MYRLCKELGIWDVHGVSRLMSWEQFREWIAYMQLEPFGEERADLRSAQIARLIAEANRDKSKRRHPFTVQEFMLFTDRDGSSKPRSHSRKPMTSVKDWEKLKSAMRVAYSKPAREEG